MLPQPVCEWCLACSAITICHVDVRLQGDIDDALASDPDSCAGLKALLNQVTRKNLPDLLHLACSRAHLDDHAAADLLLNHDEDSLHLLGMAVEPPASGDAASMSSATGSDSMLQEATAVNRDVRTTCIAHGNRTLAEELVQFPAAQHIGQGQHVWAWGMSGCTNLACCCGPFLAGC